MEKTKRNWLLTGLLAMLMMFGLCLGFGLGGSQVQTAYADGLENLAGSELKVKTQSLGYGQEDCDVTFAGGRYLHLNPDNNGTVVNNTSDGADMEYYNGVLRIYNANNDDFDPYNDIYKYIEIYALNTTDKQLTIIIEDDIGLYAFDYAKGDLTITTADEVTETKSFSVETKFMTSGNLTISGYVNFYAADKWAHGVNTDLSAVVGAEGTLRVLDHASFSASIKDYDAGHAVKVTNLVLNTTGSFYANAWRDNIISALKVDAGSVTLTKLQKMTLIAKSKYVDDFKVLTNVIALRNAPTTPISGYYATYVDKTDGYRLEVVPSNAVFTVSFDANGGSGEMAAVENVYYSCKAPACTFTAPDEDKIFDKWAIGSPDSEQTVYANNYFDVTGNTTLYAVWKEYSPSYAIRIAHFFGNRPSAETFSFNSKTGVFTMSGNLNCSIECQYPGDYTFVFDGQHAYGNSNPESNYLYIDNRHNGSITLTSDTPVTVYACILTYGSLIVKGNVHLVPTGLSSDGSGVNWQALFSDSSGGIALVNARQKISVLENASITAIDPFIYNSSTYQDNFSILRAKYFEFDTTGEVEIGTKTQVYGTHQNAAICFYDTTSTSAYSEIFGRMTIKRCGQDGCLKLYRYNNGSYKFVAIKKSGSASLGYPSETYLHFNRNISDYTTGGVTAKLMTLKPCVVTFDTGEGTGTMATDYTTVNEEYILPACTFTAPAGKHFAGWSINGADPVNANTTYAVPDQTETLTVTAVWGEYNLTVVNGGVENTITQQVGVSVTLYANTDYPGHTFVRWESEDIEIANATNPTIEFVMPAKNVRVVAVYNAQTFTVTFNSNGGSGEQEAVTTEYGNYELPVGTIFYAPEGKIFDGWALSAEGEKITTTEIYVTEDTELFALWKDASGEVEPEPQPEENKGGLGAGAIVAIVLASLIVLGVGGFAVYWFVIKKKKWADLKALFKKK